MTVSRKYMGLALAFTVMTSTITAALTAQESQNTAMLQQVIDRYGDYQVFEAALALKSAEGVAAYVQQQLEALNQ